MPDDANRPPNPWRLNPGRIVLLILGALLAVYLASALLGGLGNYQLLKEAAQDAGGEPAASP